MFEEEGNEVGIHSSSDKLIFHMPERLATKAIGYEEEEGGGQARETGRSEMTHERSECEWDMERGGCAEGLW